MCNKNVIVITNNILKTWLFEWWLLNVSFSNFELLKAQQFNKKACPKLCIVIVILLNSYTTTTTTYYAATYYAAITL